MDDQINILVNGTSTPALYQGDFMLDKFCQLRAQHYNKRDAYREAFGVPADTPNSTLDSRIKALHDKHPEIQRRIAECAGELREKWMRRLYEGLDELWHVFTVFIGDPKTAGLAMTAYKTIAATIGVGTAFEPSAGTESVASNVIGESLAQEKIDRLLTMMSRYNNQQTNEGEENGQ